MGRSLTVSVEVLTWSKDAGLSACLSSLKFIRITSVDLGMVLGVIRF